MNHINDNTKPVIFLGSNNLLYIMTEVCDLLNIKVAGIIDRDYWGNTDNICDVPVIDTEDSFSDPDKLQEYKSNFNFFCAVNWLPENNDVSVRNRQKRNNLLDVIDRYQLPCISIVDPSARISKYSSIGHGIFIDAGVHVNPNCRIDNFTNIYCNAFVGSNTHIGHNCVIQRECFITEACEIEHDSYFGLCSKALKVGAKFGSGTFVHEAIYIRRGTVANEIVSMHGANMKRIVPYPIVG
jgi:acetyltransferase-like isoleucine patch superfamily enzyme